MLCLELYNFASLLFIVLCPPFNSLAFHRFHSFVRLLESSCESRCFVATVQFKRCIRCALARLLNGIIAFNQRMQQCALKVEFNALNVIESPTNGRLNVKYEWVAMTEELHGASLCESVVQSIMLSARWLNGKAGSAQCTELLTN